MLEVKVKVFDVRDFDYSSNGGKVGSKATIKFCDNKINGSVANTKMVDFLGNTSLKLQFVSANKNDEDYIDGTLIYGYDLFSEKLIPMTIKFN